MMKLWLLSALCADVPGNPWEATWDMSYNFVVVAPDEQTAREIANNSAGAEGKVWTDPKWTLCEELRAEDWVSPTMIIQDFLAG